MGFNQLSWILVYLYETDEDAYLCQQCGCVTKIRRFACPKCNISMNGVVKGQMFMPFEDAVIPADDIKLE